MATSRNAKIEIETGRTLTTYTAMSDGGDHQVFTAGSIWSGYEDKEPVVRPNGLVTGRNILTAGGTNDTIRVAGFTAYLAGTLTTVTATTTTISRTATAGKAQIHSVTMASDGSIAVVEGTISATTAFSETRAAVGGPPLIPTTSIELGQIRVTTSTAAAVTASEIYQTVGTHTERYDYPTWTEHNIGDGSYAETNPQKQSHVKFADTLPLIHTGTIPKAVYIQYYTPTFEELNRTMDFVPAEESHSTSSQEHYRGVVNSVSSSLGQASFTALVSDGISDVLAREKNKTLTVKFYPDENKSPYMLTQGKIGIARTFPVNAQNQVSVTISAENPTVEFTS